MADIKKQDDKKNESRQEYGEKMSTVAWGSDEPEFSEALATDLKKLNQNKFFFNMDGDQHPDSQD
ncbi:MAG: hypothetical protein ACOWWO_19985 [Peptococcaceae bacterium]